MRLMRLFHTLKYLPPSQVWSQVWVRVKGVYHKTPLYPLWLERQPVPEKLLFQPKPIWQGDALHGQAIALYRAFTFVNREIVFDGPMRWLPTEAPPLWQFHLQYFDWLYDLRAAKQRDVAQDLLADWLLQCDQFQPVVWHPYPVSLRLVNWLTHADWLLKGASAEVQEAFRSSLQRQAVHLAGNLEYHLGANHLLKNIKALLFVGVCLPHMEHLFLRGEQVLLRELARQILPDGGHYERSPLYHVQVLQDVYAIHALYKQKRLRIPQALTDALEGLAKVLPFYRHLDGKLMLFSDSAELRAEALENLAKRVSAPKKIPTHLPDTGYVRLQSRALNVVIDGGKVGPDAIPGHAHAGTASIEVTLGAERVIVNGGTYAYQDKLRGYFRGTAAHSTVCLEGQNSADVWGAHRVGRRPQQVACVVVPQVGGAQQVVVQHDGYRFLGYSHQRTLTLDATGSILHGKDVIAPLGRARWSVWRRAQPKVRVHFHLHPGVQVQVQDEQHVQFLTPLGRRLSLRLNTGRWQQMPSHYAPQFGIVQDTQQLVALMHWPRKTPQVLCEWVLCEHT